MMAFLILFFLICGCSDKEQLHVDEDIESENEINSPEVVENEFEASDQIIINANYMNWQDRRKLLCFENYVFLGNDGYEYIDGCYESSEKKLIDYLPEKYSVLTAEDIESVGSVWQNANLLIFCLRNSKEYEVVVIDFWTEEVIGIYSLPQHITCVSGNKLYYLPIKTDSNGETYFTIEYLDCRDFTYHTVYESNKDLGPIIAREDGTIIFEERDIGYLMMDAEENISLLHEAVADRYVYSKSIFERFDESGLYFWAENYNHEMEFLHLEDTGILHRIQNVQFSDHVIVTDEGALFYNQNKANLCPYEYGVEDIILPTTSVSQNYEIIDIKYLEEGYILKYSYYQDGVIWWIWVKDDNKLMVTKTAWVK